MKKKIKYQHSHDVILTFK